MAKLIFLTFICMSAFILGCEEIVPDVDDHGTILQEGENFTLITSSELYKELHKKRSGEVSEEFEITGVERLEENGENYLIIEISHRLCNPETRIIWNGTVAESSPPQMFLFLQLLADGDCTNESTPEKKTEILKLNLDNLLLDESTAKQAIISVFNASRKNTGNDHADDPVSSGGE